jgi:uncharacterized membrane protein YeaQ/YmgE (transglycosylase-associated protein family)
MSEGELGRLAALLLAGVVAGWLAGLVTRGSGFGTSGNMVAGLIGALIGFYLLNAAGLTFGRGFAGAFFTALAAAFLVLAIVGEMRR